MDENKIIFTKEIGPIVLQILKDNGLEEGDDEIVEKLGKEIPLNGGAVWLSIEASVLSGYSKNKLVSLLKNNLGIDEEKSQKIADAIDAQIIPYAKKVRNEQPAQEESAPVKKIFPTQSYGKEEPERILKKDNFVAEKKPDIKPSQKTGPDNYREPIE